MEVCCDWDECLTNTMAATGRTSTGS
jgi:hypothetical protein